MTHNSHKNFSHLHFYQQILHSKKKYRSIIVLNGTIPDPTFFHYFSDLYSDPHREENTPEKLSVKKLIAVDGAANTLINMGIIPELIIGDLDSFNLSLYPSQINILHKPDPDYCDFQKALTHMEEDNLLPAIITGLNGGTLDHILQNINLFLDTDNIFYAPPIMGYTLCESQCSTHHLPIQTKLSIMGAPSARVSTHGLKWELQGSVLNFPGYNSCFNRTINQDITITVEAGRALVLIYLEPVLDSGCL